MTRSNPVIPPRLTPLLPLCEGDLIGGRYRIESLVLARTTSVQFAATDLTSGTRVSIHVLVSQHGTADFEQDSIRRAFLAGAQSAKELRGPHVARVLDAGVTFEGQPWIAREHIASPTLAAHLLGHGAIRTAEAVDIALAVCDAVAEAHARGIMHGLLGPHAVHVAWSASGLSEIKVTGLGIARAEAAVALGTARDVECILRAPEQLRRGLEVDARADVWAIGVLLHTMLAGAPPFAADTPSGASLSVILDEPPSLAGVPDELAEIVESALAKEPARRPCSVLDLADAIVCFASYPDFVRDRIIARRPPQSSAREVPCADAIDVDVAPSVREILHDPHPVFEATAPMGARPLPATAAPSAMPVPRPMTSRDEPTLIMKRPDTSVFPRRRAFKVLGLMTAAASVALLVLIGTEGARLSRRSTDAEPRAERPDLAFGAPNAAATELPVATAPALSRPAPENAPVFVAAPPVAPDAPDAPEARSAPTPPPKVVGRKTAAPPSSGGDHGSNAPPATSADELRRFFDDRQ